jgi:hypothetical protein
MKHLLSRHMHHLEDLSPARRISLETGVIVSALSTVAIGSAILGFLAEPTEQEASAYYNTSPVLAEVMQTINHESNQDMLTLGTLGLASGMAVCAAAAGRRPDWL